MTLLKIKNKKDLIGNFLGPISNLNDMCVLKITNNNIACTIASADATIVCRANLECDIDVGSADTITLNIPDIKKLVRVLEIVPAAEAVIKINSNNITYNQDGYKFRYHTLEDNIIKLPNINVNKINSLDFNTTFNVTEAGLSALYKGSSFTTETSKLYIHEDSGNISGELGDKNRHNTDNFVCVLSKTYEGQPLTKPLALNFESFRLLSFSGSREVNFRVNQDMGIITCNIQKGDVVLTYVVSALIN
jgi:hypothetical protein